MSLPFLECHDLITPDGTIKSLKPMEGNRRSAALFIERIPHFFRGFGLDKNLIFFNLKSSIAQLGVTTETKEIRFFPKTGAAEVEVDFIGLTPLGKLLVEKLVVGLYAGKLFARDPERLLKDPSHIMRQMNRADRHGQPLFALGKGDKIEISRHSDGRAITEIPLHPGRWVYTPEASFLTDILVAALQKPGILLRDVVRLSQHLQKAPHLCDDGMLLVRGTPLYFRFLFVEVAEDLLPPGIHHTSAKILEPMKSDENQVYELFGDPKVAVEKIPLQFYSLEPFRSFFTFSESHLGEKVDHPEVSFKIFETAPENARCATLLSCPSQINKLTTHDWYMKEYYLDYFPKPPYAAQDLEKVELYVEQHPMTPFLNAMEEDKITSESIIFTRYFPHPSLKRRLLGPGVRKYLKAIYFEEASREGGLYFSHEDRSLMMDLTRAGIDIFWANKRFNLLQQFAVKGSTDSGLFVPYDKVDLFRKAVTLGVYGSYLIQSNLEGELIALLKGLDQMKASTHHMLLNPSTQFVLVSGGGPGTMSQANHAARELGILSIGRLVDFSTSKLETQISEQEYNEYIEGMMTYRLDRLIERQAEFLLDLPIFMYGGYGTDFELALEELRRKVGSSLMVTPMLLFGPYDYWVSKITSRFQTNRKTGTIAGSEWCSNTLYCVENAAEALAVYQRFFNDCLPMGPAGPIYDAGFCRASKDLNGWCSKN